MEETPELTTTDPEVRQLLGLFDVPAFARRGQDLESHLERIRGQCRRARNEMLAMVRLRMKQWAAVATEPGDGAGVFRQPIVNLITLVCVEELSWSTLPASERKRCSAARELSASIARFNRRWEHFARSLDLGPINDRIEQYNRYYVFEKECSLGSIRLAARHFAPWKRLTPKELLDEYPLLPSLDLCL